MGIVLALVCAFFFGVFYIFAQKGMKVTKGNNGFFATTTFNALFLFLLYIAMLLIQQDLPNFNSLAFLYFCIAGFFTAFLGRMVLFQSILFIGSTRAAALKNAAPLFVILFAFIMIGEGVTFGASIGIFLIFSALFIQAKHDYRKEKGLDADNDKTKRTGIFLATLAAVFFGFGQTVRKQGLLVAEDAILGALVGVSIAWISFVLVSFVKKQFHLSVIEGLKVTNPYFIFAGIASGISQACFFLSASLTNISYTSVVAATEPIMVVILAHFFLKKEERINLRIIITACLVFLGTGIIVLFK